jgi:hypothetical protein
VASGIGGGAALAGNAGVAWLVIEGGEMMAEGHVGVGSAPSGLVERLLMLGSDGVILLDCRSQMPWCVAAQTAAARRGRVEAITSAQMICAPGVINQDFDSGSVEFYGEYRVIPPSSVHEPLADVRRLNLAALRFDGPDDPQPYMLVFLLIDNDIVYNRSVNFDVQAKRLIISLQWPGEYEIQAFGIYSQNTDPLQLCDHSNQTRFVVNTGEAYYTEVAVCEGPDPPSRLSVAAIVLIVVGSAVIVFAAVLRICLVRTHRNPHLSEFYTETDK